MNIITEQKIKMMFEILQPNLVEATIFMVEQEGLSKILRNYVFLKQNARDIHEYFFITHEEIIYSQYYWFVLFKNQYISRVGYDEGLDQQVFLLIENLYNELNGNVDWELIEDIENQLKVDK
jgi:hypothetical protein